MATLADRNNNPGNLRDVSTGGFRQFATPQDGYAALLNDLEAKKTGTSTTGVGPSSTLADWGNVYAPPTENDSAQYIANISNFMGVSPDTKLSDLDTGRWADSVAKAEGYQGGNAPQVTGGVAPPPIQEPAITSQPTATQSQPETQKKTGLLGGLINFGQNLVAAPASLAALPVQGLAALLKQPDPYANKALAGIPISSPTQDYEKGGIGRVAQVQAGNLAQTAGLALPAAGLPGAIGSGVLTGAGSQMSQGKDLSSTLVGGGIGGLIGAGTFGLGKLLGSGIQAAGGGSGALRQSAAKDIEQVLAPTTQQAKHQTQKYAGEVAERGITGITRPDLLEKFQIGASEAGEKVGAAFDNLPPEAQFEVGSLIKTLQTKADDLMINGTVPSAAQAKYNAYQKLTDDLVNAAKSSSIDGQSIFADVANVRKLRQILDKGKKSFAVTDLDAANQAAQKELANAIRDQFGKQFPDIGKLNADYAFWSAMRDVLSKTVERKVGQTGALPKAIAETTGAVAGVGSGGGLGGALVGANVMRALAELFGSTAWKTMSASAKMKLADLISKGSEQPALNIIQKAIVGAGQGVERLATPASRVGTQGLMQTLMGNSNASQ